MAARPLQGRKESLTSAQSWEVLDNIAAAPDTMLATPSLFPAAPAPCPHAGQIAARGKHHAQLLILFTGGHYPDVSSGILRCDA